MIKYFDFEKPIEKIDEQLIELEKDKDKNKKTIEQLKNQKEKLFNKIYASLSSWQKVHVARQ